MKKNLRKLLAFTLVLTMSIPNSMVSLAAENTGEKETVACTKLENCIAEEHAVDCLEAEKVDHGVDTTSVEELKGKGTKDVPYEISNHDELEWFRDDVNNGNNYEGKYVKLTTDINLNDEEWTPIGYQGKTFKGNFDGGNHTIENLTITKDLTNTQANNGIGFFGRTDSPAVIQNLTIENVDITGSLYVGAVVGHGYTGNKIENVNVKGDIAIDAWWYAGVIGGNGYMSSVNNCHVIGNDGSYIKGNDGSYIGGIWGFRGEGNMSTTNCSVENLNISGVDRVGGITGQAHYGNSISQCTVKNTTIKATDAKATTVGLIAGACQGTESSPTVFENNTVYSNVTATAGDASVIGMYGTNINGEVPSVEGNEFSEILSYSAEIVDGEKYLTLEEAITSANEGETVKLLSDISGVNSLEINKKITLDLNGKTLTTNGRYGGLLLKGGCSLKNGTLVHNGTVAAIKLWNAESIENIKIQVTGVEGKTIGGIVLQQGATTRVDSLKYVEIAGATNGIETYNCGNATEAVIGKMEYVKISATDTGMLISAPVGTAKNCEIYGENIGIVMYRKGTYSTTLTLEDSKVTGKNVPIFVHDENFYDENKINTGKVELKIDTNTELISTNNDYIIETKLGMKEEANSTIEYNNSKCVATKEDGSVEYYIEHSCSKEWSFDENGHYHICEKCGEIDTVVKHQYVLDETTVKEATCTTEGYTGDKKCECGHVVKGEVIPDTGHKEGCPHNGETTPEGTTPDSGNEGGETTPEGTTPDSGNEGGETTPEGTTPDSGNEGGETTPEGTTPDSGNEGGETTPEGIAPDSGNEGGETTPEGTTPDSGTNEGGETTPEGITPDSGTNEKVEAPSTSDNSFVYGYATMLVLATAGLVALNQRKENLAK